MTEQGEAFAEFIQRELGDERDRRKVLDTRGVAVVTTSSSLLTLLSVVTALTARQAGSQLPAVTSYFLLGTIIAFAGTTFCGIMATVPWRYRLTHRSTLQAMATERWATNEADARSFVAQSEVKTVDSLRSGNTRKGSWLLAALFVQLVGLILLTITIALILLITK